MTVAKQSAHARGQSKADAQASSAAAAVDASLPTLTDAAIRCGAVGLWQTLCGSSQPRHQRKDASVSLPSVNSDAHIPVRAGEPLVGCIAE